MNKILICILISVYVFFIPTKAMGECGLINCNISYEEEKTTILLSDLISGEVADFSVAKIELSNLKYDGYDTENIKVYDNLMVVYGNIEEIIKSIKLSVIDETIESAIKVSFYNRNIKIAKINGQIHYYEFINGEYLFNEALQTAKTYTVDGLKGYLVTVTSKEEDELLNSFNTPGWAGATCGVIVDGNYVYSIENCKELKLYKWIDGPESGMDFTSTGYTNFHIEEPNNKLDKELYLILNDLAGGTWNDLYDAKKGFFVEYSEYGNQKIAEDTFFQKIFSNKKQDGDIVLPDKPSESNDNIIPETKVIDETSIVELPKVESNTNEISQVIVDEPIVSEKTTKNIVIKKESRNAVVEQEVEKDKKLTVTFINNENSNNLNKISEDVKVTKNSDVKNVVFKYTIFTMFTVSLANFVYKIVQYFRIKKIK